VLWSIMDWLYPPICAGCGSRGRRWCDRCQDGVEVVTPPICHICGEMDIMGEICNHCQESPPCFTALRSWAVFKGPVRQAIHRLKYKKDVALGEVLSRPLIRFLQGSKWNIDLILPVPLGVARLEERGYNQSDLIARPVALYFGVEYLPKAIRRRRETRSQVDLSAAERKVNVAGAFESRPKFVTGQNVLVIDDVTTTGATLDACAFALREAGAKEVYGLTVARSGWGA
jgi:competence protein ComFC